MPLRLGVFLLCLVPLPMILWQVGQTPDPGKELVLLSGLWAIRFLIITLSITPLKRWLSLAAAVSYRRMMGLYLWFYATVHLVAVMTYLLGWSWQTFVEEFAERPYMALGIIAWCLLLPLGLTSNRWMQRKLRRRWKVLHRLVYVIAVLVCGHFIWLIRSDYGEAMTYSLIILVLLCSRFPFITSRRSAVVG